jgi:endonuclease YncB( thermonuclease family)
MKKSFGTSLVAWFLFFTFLASPSLLLADQYQVSRVIDGDTIRVEDGSKKITVRLVGIDAPETSKRKNEPGQPFSQRATKHFASLARNQTGEIKSYGNDRDARMLGEVFFEDRNINLEMVKAGLAEVYRGKPAPGFEVEKFREAEEEARKAGRAMWVQGG